MRTRSAVAVLALVCAGCGGHDSSSQPVPGPSSGSAGAAVSGSSTPSASPEPAVNPLLDPRRPILIGRHRYVSPCQVLTQADYEAAFSPLGTQDFAREDYLESSQRGDDLTPSYKTSCDYGPSHEIELDADEYVDAHRLSSDLAFAVDTLNLDEVPGDLTRLSRAAQQSGDADLVSLVSKLRAGRAAYLKADRPGASVKAEGLLIPLGGFDVAYVHANVVYSLLVGGPVGHVTTAGTSEVGHELEEVGTALTAIRAHAARQSTLTQSPLPTELTGGPDRSGLPSLLEPCGILDARTVTHITGHHPDAVVQRVGLPKDTVTTRYATADHVRLFPMSSCSRNEYHVDQGGRSVELDLETAPDTRSLIAKLRAGDYLPLTGADVLLHTHADFAAYLPTPGLPSLYVFRVGPYFLQLDIIDPDGEGFGDAADRATYVDAINRLTDRLRAQVEAVS